jgi:hypothetical protein
VTSDATGGDGSSSGCAKSSACPGRRSDWRRTAHVTGASGSRAAPQVWTPLGVPTRLR